MTGAALPDAARIALAPPTSCAADSTLLLDDELPATRLLSHGAEMLSDAEVVALVTRTHIRTVEDLRDAQHLVRDGIFVLARRADAHATDLRRSDVLRLAAALEFGRRALGPRPTPGDVFDPQTIGPVLAARYATHVQERLGVLLLDARNRILGIREVFVGTLNTCAAVPRDILRIALDYHASAVVLYHNHPSGDPTPSPEDLRFSQRMRAAAALLDVHVLDHLILANPQFLSLRQRGDL